MIVPIGSHQFNRLSVPIGTKLVQETKRDDYMGRLKKIDESKKRARQYLFMYLVDRKRESGEWKKSKWGNIKDVAHVAHTVPPRWYSGERNITDQFYEPLSKIFDVYVSVWRDVKEEYFIYNGEDKPIEEANTLDAIYFFGELGKYKFSSLHDYYYKRKKILETLHDIIFKEIPENEGLIYKPLDFRDSESIFSKKLMVNPGDSITLPIPLESVIYDSIVELINSGNINGKQPDYFKGYPSNFKSKSKFYPINYDASQEFIKKDPLIKDEYEIYSLECSIECGKKHTKNLINELNEIKEKPSKKTRNEYYLKASVESLSYLIEFSKEAINEGECRLEEMKQKYEQKKKDCDLGTDQQSQSKTDK